MNERIRELSLQASDSIPDDVSAEHAMYLFQKTFAELIVRESIDTVLDSSIEYTTRPQIAKELKEHFGVDE